MIMHKVTTLNQFIIERQAEIPGATGEFSRLLHHIGIAAKKVHREVNKAGLVDILGKVGSIKERTNKSWMSMPTKLLWMS